MNTLEVQSVAGQIMQVVGKTDADGMTTFNGDIIVPALTLCMVTMLIAIADEAEFETRLGHATSEITKLARTLRKTVKRRPAS